jgi:hypothetical protein
MATATNCATCGVRFMGRNERQRYCCAAHRTAPGYQSPTTASGRRWNEGKARNPCLEPGCTAPRYQSPAGWVNTRCREHEALIHRQRWAAQHPAYQARPAGRAGATPTLPSPMTVSARIGYKSRARAQTMPSPSSAVSIGSAHEDHG